MSLLRNHPRKFSMQPDQVNDISYTLRRHYVDVFHQEAFSSADVCGGMILDLGGNKKAKRGQFDIDCLAESVIYANLSVAKSPDVVTDAALLPFGPGTFDTAICSELLEHVYDPRKVIVEVCRALKPGGSLIICAPFMVGIHGDPYDYARYTDSFWRQILDETGFTDINIQPQGSFYSVIYDMLRSKIYGAIAQWGPERKISISIVGRILGMLKIAALGLDTRSITGIGSKGRAITTGFGIKAIKK